MFFLVVVCACEQPPAITPDYPNVITANGGLYILNEGNFQSGNASLDYMSFTDLVLHENAFTAKNGRNLGDVLQSITRWGDVGYLVVNNSQKIEVVDMNTLQSKATITGFKSPRYMVVQNTNTAFVSEYYQGGVKVLNLNTNQIIATIPVPGNCEEMVLLNGKLYVAAANTRYVYVVNTISNAVADSIDVAYGPNSLRLDKNNNLWVLSAGINNGTVLENGALQKIDVTIDSVLTKFEITPQSEHGSIKLRMNAQLNTLYWINKSVYQHPINQPTLNALPFIFSNKNAYWALNYDSLTNELYVGDAVDYNQRSNINRYDLAGNLRGTFKGGIITTDFYFWYK